MILTTLLLHYKCVHNCICDSDCDIFFPKNCCRIMKRASISALPAMPFQHHRNYHLLLHIEILVLYIMIVGED